MKVVIADDEPLARERLRLLLAEHAGVEIVAEADNGLSALQACAEFRPDLVLLDIAMPGVDGLEAARHLTAFDPRPAVVFCTAYDEHALSAFDAAAIDYLMKPVRAERLAVALERARTFVAGRENHAPAAPNRQPRSHLCARLRGSLRLIPVVDVHYLQAEEKYGVVHHARGEDLIEESLKSLEDEFSGRFVRIHRNCLVARAAIRGFERSGGTTEEPSWSVVLDGLEARLPVSRRMWPVVKELVAERPE